MFKRTAITFAAASLATAMGFASAQAAPDSRMLGQSARAGASYDADMRGYYAPPYAERVAGQSARAGTAYDVDTYEMYDAPYGVEPYAPRAGQSARAGTAYDRDLRAERAGYQHRAAASWAEDPGMYPYSDWDEEVQFDRAARPDKQR